jgi:large subunit ribosomal protein L23
MIDLLKNVIVTEKAYQMLAKNKYLFDMDIRLTKPQIKQLIQDLFKVNVISVNTHISPLRKKRFRPKYKRAIITVKAGQTIPIVFTNRES